MANGLRVNYFEYDADYNIVSIISTTKPAGRTRVVVEILALINAAIAPGHVIELDVIIGFSPRTGGQAVGWTREACLFTDIHPVDTIIPAIYVFRNLPEEEGQLTVYIERRNDPTNPHGTVSQVDLFTSRTSVYPKEE